MHSETMALISKSWIGQFLLLDDMTVASFFLFFFSVNTYLISIILHLELQIVPTQTNVGWCLKLYFILSEK